MKNLITNIFIQIKAHLIPIQQLIYFLPTYLLFTYLFTFIFSPLLFTFLLHYYLLLLFLNTTIFKHLFSLKICVYRLFDLIIFA